jgi:RNA polymerase sigma factor (sigma-70 family)
MPEGDLLERARAGDSRALDALLTPYRDRLWGVCLRTTSNRSDAEDALQEALVAIWKHLGDFRGEASFGTWAYRIASNAALAVVRRRRDLTGIGADAAELEIEDTRRDFVDTIADRDRVQRALRDLPEDFRTALVLREYGQLTYEEIAAHQGVLVQTVKSRLNRARTAVAAALAADS